MRTEPNSSALLQEALTLHMLRTPSTFYIDLRCSLACGQYASAQRSRTGVAAVCASQLYDHAGCNGLAHHKSWKFEALT